MLPDTASGAGALLSPAARDAADRALAAVRADAARWRSQADAVSSPLSALWGDLTGIDSAQAAVRTSAAASEKLLAVLEARRLTLRTDADAAAFVRDAAAGVSSPELHQLAGTLTATGGAAVIARDSGRDLADAAVSVGTGWLAVLKASPFLVAGLLLFVAWSWLRPKGRA